MPRRRIVILTAGSSEAVPPLELPDGLICEGDSRTQGTSAVAAVYGDWPTLLSAQVNGTVTNNGNGGDTTADVLADIAAESAGDKAKPHVIEAGYNDYSGGISADTVDNIADMVTALGHSNVLVIGIPHATTQQKGEFLWAEQELVNQQLRDTYTARFVDTMPVLQAHHDGSGTDLTNVAEDTIPTSLLDPDDPGNVVHLNATGNGYVAEEAILPALGGIVGDIGMPSHFRKFAITSEAEAGSVQAAIRGTPGSMSISGSALFAIDNSGVITFTPGAPTEPYYDLTVGARKGARSLSQTLRLGIGSRAADTPKKVTFNDKMRIVMPRAPSGLDSGLISLAVLGLKMAAGDGVVQYIVGGELTNRFTLTRTSTNKLQLQVYNSSGASVLNFRTAANVLAADNFDAFFFSADLSGAGGSANCQIYRNSTSTMTFTTGTGGATMHLDRKYVFGAQNDSSGNPWQGGDIGVVMAWSGIKIDWSNAANRDALWNSGTRLPTPLANDGSFTPSGAGSPAVPFLCWGGNKADWYSGRNRGSGGTTIGAPLSGVSIT